MPSFLFVPPTIDHLKDAELVTFHDETKLFDIANKCLENDALRHMTTLNLQQTHDKTWEIIYVVENDDAQPNKLASHWFPFTKINGPLVIIQGDASLTVPKSKKDESDNDIELSQDDLRNPDNFEVNCTITEVDKEEITQLMSDMPLGTLVYTNGSTCKWPCDKPFGNVKKFINQYLGYGYLMFVYWNENSQESVNEVASKIYGQEIRGDALFTLQVDEHVVTLYETEIRELFLLSKYSKTATELESFQHLNETHIRNRFQAVLLKKLQVQYVEELSAKQS